MLKQWLMFSVEGEEMISLYPDCAQKVLLRDGVGNLSVPVPKFCKIIGRCESQTLCLP